MYVSWHFPSPTPIIPRPTAIINIKEMFNIATTLHNSDPPLSQRVEGKVLIFNSKTHPSPTPVDWEKGSERRGVTYLVAQPKWTRASR